MEGPVSAKFWFLELVGVFGCCCMILWILVQFLVEDGNSVNSTL